jgi:putative two-component system response regulator
MKYKILIVDDQEFNIVSLKDYLQEYNVIEATSNGDILEIVNEVKPDLILLDVISSDIDGYSILSMIKSTKETRLTPVILVTSLSGTDEKVKSYDKGADEFITKPFQPLELTAKVKSLLRVKSYQDELENAQNLVISLAQALEAKDQYSNRHSQRTSEYAKILASSVSQDLVFIDQIVVAGLLHDIGKIGISDYVLQKPGKLDKEEFEIIKTHPVVGEKICSSINSFQPFLPWIKHHHESWDGKGYPDNLKGENIPYGARIIAIADAFDAMISDRPYRKALELEEVCKIFREGAGKQWDAQLVNVFLKLIDEKKVKPLK